MLSASVRFQRCHVSSAPDSPMQAPRIIFNALQASTKVEAPIKMGASCQSATTSARNPRSLSWSSHVNACSYV